MKKPLPYIHKATEVRALRWTGDNIDAVKDFVGPARFGAHNTACNVLYIWTCEGVDAMPVGYWLVIDERLELSVIPDVWFSGKYAETCDHHPV